MWRAVVTQLHSDRPSLCLRSRTLNRKNIACQLTLNALQTTGLSWKGCRWRNRQAVAWQRGKLHASLCPHLTVLPLTLWLQRGNACVVSFLLLPILNPPWPFLQHWSFDGRVLVYVYASRKKGTQRGYRWWYLGWWHQRGQMELSNFPLIHVCIAWLVTTSINHTHIF